MFSTGAYVSVAGETGHEVSLGEPGELYFGFQVQTLHPGVERDAIPLSLCSYATDRNSAHACSWIRGKNECTGRVTSLPPPVLPQSPYLGPWFSQTQAFHLREQLVSVGP